MEPAHAWTVAVRSLSLSLSLSERTKRKMKEWPMVRDESRCGFWPRRCKGFSQCSEEDENECGMTDRITGTAAGAIKETECKGELSGKRFLVWLGNQWRLWSNAFSLLTMMFQWRSNQSLWMGRTTHRTLSWVTLILLLLLTLILFFFPFYFFLFFLFNRFTAMMLFKNHH